MTENSTGEMCLAAERSKKSVVCRFFRRWPLISRANQLVTPFCANENHSAASSRALHRLHSVTAMTTAAWTVPATMWPVATLAGTMAAMHAVTRMRSVCWRAMRVMRVMRTMHMPRPVRRAVVIRTAIGLIDVDITIAIAIPGACRIAARQKQHKRKDSKQLFHT